MMKIFLFLLAVTSCVALNACAETDAPADPVQRGDMGTLSPDAGQDIRADAEEGSMDTGAVDMAGGEDLGGLEDMDSGADMRPPEDQGSGDMAGVDMGPEDQGSVEDVGAEDQGPADLGGAVDMAPEPDMGPEVELGRGLRWVRDNPMMINGLVVRMGPPDLASVNQYWDEFGGNTIHLWQTGVPDELDAWRAHRPGSRFIAWMSDDGTSSANNLVLGGYPANVPGRIGWQVGDEPRTMEAFEALLPGFRAVRDADPEGLRILNFTYLAGYDTLDVMVRRFVEEVDGDVISYDRYTLGRSVWPTLSYFRQQGLRYGVPYWRYLNAYTDGGHEAWTETDLMWDAFVGLTMGYTGHSWFVYQVSSPPEEGLRPLLFNEARFGAAPAPMFAVVARLNRELAVLGRAITQLTSTDFRYVPGLPGLPPEGVQEWAVGAGEDPYITSIGPANEQPFQELAVGFFEDDAGERYLMIQNQNREGGSFPNESTLPIEVLVRFDFTGAPGSLDRGQVEVLRRQTGVVEALALEGSGEARALRVTLQAAEPILFKYKTARPFALQPYTKSTR